MQELDRYQKNRSAVGSSIVFSSLLPCIRQAWHFDTQLTFDFMPSKQDIFCTGNLRGSEQEAETDQAGVYRSLLRAQLCLISKSRFLPDQSCGFETIKRYKKHKYWVSRDLQRTFDWSLCHSLCTGLAISSLDHRRSRSAVPASSKPQLARATVAI